MSETKEQIKKNAPVFSYTVGGIGSLIGLVTFLQSQVPSIDSFNGLRTEVTEIKKILPTIQAEQAEIKKDLMEQIAKTEEKLDKNFTEEINRLEDSLKQTIENGIKDFKERSTQIDNRIISRIQEDAAKQERRFLLIEQRLNDLDRLKK